MTYFLMPMHGLRFLIRSGLLLLVSCFTVGHALAQPGFTPTIKKPKEFENRTLRSEKSDQKKFSTPKKFVQNTVTHYNYFFNANNKINEIIARAKLANKDDFGQLLSFYNYSLDVTAADTIQLDSVAYKAQSGIVLHDLRSDWADNMYILWGASYFLKKQFDSAYLMFQFINSAFAKKESDGYYLNIGSARDGNDARSISTAEKSSFTRNLFTRQPSRNDAFIWQIRNHLEQDHYVQAATLIQVLKTDPAFPRRLQPDLEEMQAYYFYRQDLWDSSAAHLEKALPNATNKQERARWEYLIAQMYENSGKNALAEEYYSNAITHTTDPVMDVYARLGSVRVNRDDNQNTIDKNVATLVKMAGRDRYIDYRDIIYYMAAQMELERDNTDAALQLLLRSTKYTSTNPAQRNKAFLQLAELTYSKRQYRESRNFYDSLKTDDPTLTNPDEIASRRQLLSKLVKNMDVISRQDSLQRLAALPEADRKDLVKKLTRQLRKQQGLKEEAGITMGSNGATANNNTAPTSLFNNNTKGEWYFYNSNLRQKGNADFKSRWGTRPNVDNWRRSAAVIAKLNAPLENRTPDQPLTQGSTEGIEGTPELTFDYLYGKIPLTPEQVKLSNDSVQQAMFTNGVTLVRQMEDCITGTTLLEQFRTRFPDYKGMDEVLFNLYYCYNRNGDKVKTDPLKSELTKRYPASDYTSIVSTGKSNSKDRPQEEPTKLYEKIYDQFIEGQFGEAVAAKKTADSLYGKNYWSPQLLYIEAVYYIRQREDSTAKKVLGNIIGQFPGKPLAIKAANLLSVLERRKEIEEELRNLVIVMPVEDSTSVAVIPAPVQEPVDTFSSAPGITNKPVRNAVTGKPDLNTGKPAPGIVAGKAGIGITKPPVDTTAKLAVKPPADTLNKVVARPAVDTATKIVKKPATDTATKVVKKPATDTINKAIVKAPPVSPNTFNFDASLPHYVVIVLTKVDPIFVGEAKNAFYRYNKDTYYNKQMAAELVEIDQDNRLLLVSPFRNAAEAVTYVDETRPKTGSSIIPWLKGGKYFYLIISEPNLQVLKQGKDVEKYRQFLEKNLPGKF